MKKLILIGVGILATFIVLWSTTPAPMPLPTAHAQFGFGKSGSMPKKSTPQTCNTNRRGQIYYDTDTDSLFGCNGSTWQVLGSFGGVITDDGTDATVASGGQLVIQAGTKSAPSIVLSGDPNTGFFSLASDTASVAAGGVEIVRWTSAQYASGANGSTNAPHFTWVADLNLGMYRIGADHLGFAADQITFEGYPTYETWRADFLEVAYATQINTGGAAGVADADENFLFIHGTDNLQFISYRIEAPNGPGLAATPTPGAVAGSLNIDGFVDDVDNEGIVLYFGANVGSSTNMGRGINWEEGVTGNMYCEAQIDIVNISAIDDFWFGWVLTDLVDNPPASADYDTMAIFTIDGNAGDLKIETELNDTTTPESDDAGTDWTDGDQFILRVNMLDATVTFEAELTDAGSTIESISQTNAILNADSGDNMACVAGFTNVAGESLGLSFEYVEIGFN